MWTRVELKSRAKACLKKYYWAALAVTFLVGILGGGNMSFGGGGGAAAAGNQANQAGTQAPSGSVVTPNNLSMMTAVAGIMLVVVLIGALIGLIFRIFISNPVTVGGKRYFMESRAVSRSAGAGKIFHAFGGGHYFNVVKTMFLRDLFVSLWTLLLIVPGVIKSYQYYMVPYILSENPEMNYRDVLDLSRKMMDGQKWNTFVLELSFMGWYFLGAILCVVGMLFVTPYLEATVAELYAVLRRNVGAVGLNGFGGEDGTYDRVVSEQ